MRLRLRPLLGLLAALLLSAPAEGQDRVVHSAEPYFSCRVPVPEPGQGAGAFVAHHLAPGAAVLHRGAGQAAATFEVTYDGFSEEAETAFQAAVDVWAAHVASPQPIRIRARCRELAGNLLGSAGPYLITGFQGAPAPVPATWYPYALADALAGRDLDPSRPDIEAEFNADYNNWYFGVQGDGPPNLVEFFTVVLHELGHGLGFIGSATVENGQGDLGLRSSSGAEYPFIYDRFTEDALGRPLLDTSVYPQPSAALANALTSNGVYFGGTTVEGVYGGPAPLYAPSSWNQGSSYSHFDERAFPPDSADGLMTPLIAPGEKKDSPGPLLCAALRDLGWALAPACDALVTGGLQEPPSASAEVEWTQAFAAGALAGSCAGSVTLPTEPYVLELDGPNPFRDRTALSLRVRDTQRVQAWLFDAAGRRLFTLLDTTVSGGATEVLRIDGSALPSGVYFVYVVGEDFTETRTITNLR